MCSVNATGAELVRTSEYVKFNDRIMMFMELKGYAVKKNFLVQDNQIVIMMEIKDRVLCTGNSIHINIGYIFVKERVDRK